MNSIFKKDITIKTISVLLALFLWFIVLNIADPFKTVTLSVPLTVINENVLQERGMVNKIKDYPRIISVTVKTRESAAKNLTANDFKATADFSKIQSLDEKVLPIDGPMYTGSSNEQDIQIVEVKPLSIAIDMDRLGQNPFKLEVRTLGNLKANYKILKITSVPETFQIQSIDSQIKTVGSIVAAVDVQDLDRDLSIRTDCKVYNKNGEEISELSRNLSADIKIEVGKEVAVTPVVRGNPARNYTAGGITVSPEKVVITGDPQVLDKISDLKTEPISLENVSASLDTTRALVLPQGVKLAGGAQEIAVSVAIDQQINKTLTISKDDISLLNTGAGDSLEYEILTPQISMTIQGVRRILENINTSSLNPTIDVRGLTVGTHKVPVRVTLANGVTLYRNSTGESIGPAGSGNTTVSLEDYQVEVKVTDKANQLEH